MNFGKLLLFIGFSVFMVNIVNAQKAKKKQAENDPWAAYEAEKNKMVEDADKKTDEKTEKKGEKNDAKKTDSSSSKQSTVKKSPKPKYDKNAPKSNTQFRQNKGVATEETKDSSSVALKKVEEYLKMKAQQGVKRPTVKPQDIKDPIDRTQKGPSGETVYKSPHGGRYYIDGIGNKIFITPDK